MVTLRAEEQEPMLPTASNEKAAFSDNEEYGHPVLMSQRRSTKMDMFKRLVVALALMMMGASTLKLYQRYCHHRQQHPSHHHLGSGSDIDMSTWSKIIVKGHHGFQEGGQLNYGLPVPQGPKGKKDRPHWRPHGPPHHQPTVDCVALENGKTVHMNLTTSPNQIVFLDPSLDGSKIDVETVTSAKTTEIEDRPHPPSRGPPPRGPPPSPSPPPPPHHHGHCRKPSTVLVSVKQLANEGGFEANKTNATLICALDVPFGAKRIGLFYEKPELKKPCHKRKHDKHSPKSSKERKSADKIDFAPVAVKLSFAKPGYTITSQHPFDHHHGHGPHKHRVGLRKKIKDWFKSWKKAKKHTKHEKHIKKAKKVDVKHD